MSNEGENSMIHHNVRNYSKLSLNVVSYSRQAEIKKNVDLHTAFSSRKKKKQKELMFEWNNAVFRMAFDEMILKKPTEKREG